MSSRARSSAADTNGRHKKMRKKKKPSPTTEPTSILSLPNDLLLNCLARVSRLYYLTLSLVSKKFLSIIASSELYKTRSYLNRTEICLYLCLRFPSDPNTSLFTLCRTPKRGNLLSPVPSPHLPPSESTTLVAAGSEIYNIGGNNEVSSSLVSVLDCKSNKWEKAPSMGVEQSSSSTANLLDGKIYVAGGCEDLNSSNWFQVFDPKTQTWRSLTNPGLVKSGGRELKGGFKWYDVKASLWKRLNGVEGLPRFGNCLIVDVGGKMMVLWDESVDYSENVI